MRWKFQYILQSLCKKQFLIPRKVWLNAIPLVLLSIFMFVCIWACHPKNPLNDHQNLPNVTVKVVRFEELLKEVEDQQQLDDLISTHPEFSSIYFDEIVNISHSDGQPLVHIDTLDQFLKDHFIAHLFDTVKIVYPNLRSFESNMTTALRHFNSHFNLDSSFHIYTFVSGLAYQRILFLDRERDALAIGLDLFLGADYPYHQINPSNPSFSSYLSRTFDRHHLVKKSLELLVDDRLPQSDRSTIVGFNDPEWHEIYVLQQLLPETSDTILFEYTEEQWQWCLQNELEMWSFLLDRELLYERDMRKISKYVLPSPYSPGMPDEAPGQSANFIW